MKSTVSLQVDTDILLRLIAQLRQLGGTQDVSEGITAAIAFWLDERAKLPAGLDPSNVRGYQWKSLFLPEGTVLRSWSYGEHNYACVEGDLIIHQGRAVSPNQFAQSFARSTRNAWTDIFIRRPGDQQFKLACHLRRASKEQDKAPAQAAPAPQTDAVGQILAALLQHGAVPVAPVKPPERPRDVTPEPGWNLPERRQFRYRLEDVAFD